MATVTSTWASAAPSISGSFTPGEWAGAGSLPMPGGVIFFKNDANFLYLAIDLVNDTGNSPGVGDYFWLSFDVDRSGSITPNFDVHYAIYPALPIRIARQFYLGPGAWTGILSTPSPALAQQGFSATPLSPVPHRIWELRIPLSEIGLAALGAATLPYVRFGLRVASTTPPFVTDFPPGFFTSFAGLHTAYLSTAPDTAYPAGTAGPVVGGVGLIPFSAISGGRATTAPGQIPSVDHAAFGGVLNLIYNHSTVAGLWAAGARRYSVLHRVGDSGAFAPLRRTWLNYRWNGSDFALDYFGPDANDHYELRDPALVYSTKDLLFQWNTTGNAGEPPTANGLHEFQIQFYNAAGAVVAAPAQSLQLFIDNALPQLQIYEIRYQGVAATPCSIVEIKETPDPVQVRFRAFDPEGNLLSYSLQALYGLSGTPPVNLLPAGVGAYPGGNWSGVADMTVDCPVAPVKFPSSTCAYQFRLSAVPRVTNGYGYIGYIETTTPVTLRRAGAPAFVAPKAVVAPFGAQPGPEGFSVVGS